MEYAQQLRQNMVNVPNGAQLFTVKGNSYIYFSNFPAYMFNLYP